VSWLPYFWETPDAYFRELFICLVLRVNAKERLWNMIGRIMISKDAHLPTVGTVNMLPYMIKGKGD
jgi:hypothetical protein